MNPHRGPLRPRPGHLGRRRPQALPGDRHELRDAGYRGLLSPSASLPGVTNLTLFDARRELFARPGSTPNIRPDLYVHVNLAADLSPPPAHILGIVRYYGDPHLGYEEWKAAPV